jgi:hypothetical protein
VANFVALLILQIVDYPSIRQEYAEPDSCWALSQKTCFSSGWLPGIELRNTRFITGDQAMCRIVPDYFPSKPFLQAKTLLPRRIVVQVKCWGHRAFLPVSSSLKVKQADRLPRESFVSLLLGFIIEEAESEIKEETEERLKTSSSKCLKEHRRNAEAYSENVQMLPGSITVRICKVSVARFHPVLPISTSNGDRLYRSHSDYFLSGCLK